MERNNKCVAQTTWHTSKKDSIKLWKFLRQQQGCWKKIKKITVINGPGNFSSLRAMSGVVKVWSVVQNCQIHSATAEQVLHSYLQLTNQGAKKAIIDSSGQSILWPEKGKYQRVQTTSVINKVNKKHWAGVLSAEKKQQLGLCDARPQIQFLLLAMQKNAATITTPECWSPYYFLAPV